MSIAALNFSCAPTSAEAMGDFDMDFNMFSDYVLNDDYMNNNQPDFFAIELNPNAQSSFNSFGNEDEALIDESDNKPRKGKGRAKAQDQMDKRRERNKILARKTRMRKKFFFESLQTQVQGLARENELLKKTIRERLPDHISSRILKSCQSVDLPAQAANISIPTSHQPDITAVLHSPDFALIQAIQAAQRSFVITDPSLPDNPIIFASQGFLELTGYGTADILGRNCRFLQGPKTDQKEVAKLREGIMRGVDTSVCLLNYRANGEEFYNQIFCAALRDEHNQIINFVGVQVELKHHSISNQYSSYSGKVEELSEYSGSETVSSGTTR